MNNGVYPQYPGASDDHSSPPCCMSALEEWEASSTFPGQAPAPSF